MTTAGPWYEIGPHGDGSKTIASGDHGTVVCALMPHEAHNAKLIAAAPDMLAALREVLRCAALPEEWAAPIRAAIAKASE